MPGHHVVRLEPADHAALMSGETIEVSTEDGYEVTIAGDVLTSDQRGLLRQPGQLVAAPCSDGREVLLDTALIDDLWTDEVFTIRVDDDARHRLLDGDLVEVEAEGGEVFDIDGAALGDTALHDLRAGGIARVALGEELLALDCSELEPVE